jgi:hypothetical protein
LGAGKVKLKVGLGLGAGIVAMALVSSAFAGDCTLHVKRTACTGHEAESFAKCDGKAECDQPSDAATADACSKAAADACANSRPQVTKFKVMTATFKGAALAGGYDASGAASSGGPNFCAANRPDLNQCQ